MSDYEKEHPFMNEVTRTINELYVHKKDEKVLQALLKHEGMSKERLKAAKKGDVTE